MDLVTRSLMDSFSRDYQISGKQEFEQFEYFCIYSIISKILEEPFDVIDVIVGAGNDMGIDGIAIIVNGRITNDVSEIDGLIEANNKLELSLVFIQTKTSSSFDSGEVMKFLSGVENFFDEEPNMPQNEFVNRKYDMFHYILKNHSSKLKKNASIYLYYVTTGTWNSSSHILAHRDNTNNRLISRNMFDSIDFEFLGAREIQAIYRSIQTRVETLINFDQKVTLPDIDGVEEAYIGILSIFEYLKLIVDEHGDVRKSVFYDNIRDFQGDNPVNGQIAETLKSAHASRFVVLNNGATIVAKEIRSTGNRYTLRDYQIVNGCQTSHVIYKEMINASPEVQKRIFVPVKIASVSNEDVIIQAIKSTNSQTEVTTEQLASLSEFHKRLEDFYNAIPEPDRLYYERRSGQYGPGSVPNRTKIITVSTQLKAFVSMFLEKPNRAWGYSGSLWKETGTQAFQSKHDPIMYYVSALALYKIEYMTRNEIIDSKLRRLRYVMLMILRAQICGYRISNLDSKDSKKNCEKIRDVLISNNYQDQIKKTLEVIKVFQNEIDDDKDIVKNSAFIDKIRNYLAETYK